MNAEPDWRLTGQEKILKEKVFVFRRYAPPTTAWDHDHCVFCWEKFSESTSSGALQEGFATEDLKYWVCPDCFEDFRDRFSWTLK